MDRGNNAAPCIGFWNMCGCEFCTARDRELSTCLESANYETRRDMVNEAFKEMIRERGLDIPHRSN